MYVLSYKCLCSGHCVCSVSYSVLCSPVPVFLVINVYTLFTVYALSVNPVLCSPVPVFCVINVCALSPMCDLSLSYPALCYPVPVC